MWMMTWYKGDFDDDNLCFKEWQAPVLKWIKVDKIGGNF